MSLKEKIRIDLKEAMKTGETDKRDTLRMLESAIKNEEIGKKKREQGLNDEEILAVISRFIKQRKDSAFQYEKGGRPELAEKENREIIILSAYLPAQLSVEEIGEVVRKIIAEIGAKGHQDMGKVMQASMVLLKGKADGAAVKEIVEKELSLLEKTEKND